MTRKKKMNPLLAGILSGSILGLVFLGYLIFRYRAVAEMFQEDDQELSSVSEQQMALYLTLGFLGTALFFGASAGLVYRALNNPGLYQGIAYGAAVLFSVIALISKTPLPIDKVFWNLAVGGILGTLVPLFSG
jgi:heme/copper-type cytochrome/quinol oxidase subunit 3